MERKRTRQYRVIDLTNGDVWDFRTADGVAGHLFGKWPIQDYAIYKAGKRWGRKTGGEITRWTEALDKWHPE